MTRPAALAGLLAALFVSGCGPREPDLAAVGGVVTVNGRPLPNLEVVFVPDPDRGTAGREFAAYTDAAGRYQIPLDPGQKVGVVVGVHRVLVRDADMYLVPPGGGTDPESGEAVAGKAARPARKASRVPLAYGDTAATPLRDVRVDPGSGTFDISIVAK